MRADGRADGRARAGVVGHGCRAVAGLGDRHRCIDGHRRAPTVSGTLTAVQGPCPRMWREWVHARERAGDACAGKWMCAYYSWKPINLTRQRTVGHVVTLSSTTSSARQPEVQMEDGTSGRLRNSISSSFWCRSLMDSCVKSALARSVCNTFLRAYWMDSPSLIRIRRSFSLPAVSIGTISGSPSVSRRARPSPHGCHPFHRGQRHVCPLHQAGPGSLFRGCRSAAVRSKSHRL